MLLPVLRNIERESSVFEIDLAPLKGSALRKPETSQEQQYQQIACRFVVEGNCGSPDCVPVMCLVR